MKKQIIFIFILAITCVSGIAQKLPDWIINKPTPTNNTYLYVVESATGQTEMQARNRAIAEVFRSTAMRIGQPIDSEEINRALQSGTEYYVISSQYNVPINKVCEYTDNKTSPCRVYVLCQVAKAGNIHVEFDDFNACYEGNNKVYADEALYAKGFDVFQNGRKLSEGEIRTMFANSKSYYLYDGGRNREDNSAFYLFGGAMLFFSVGCFVGVAIDEGWNDPTDKGWITAGKALAGSGVALIIIGGIRSSIGKAKIRKAVNLYNNGRMYSQSNLEMEYGLTGNGAYITLSF